MQVAPCVKPSKLSVAVCGRCRHHNLVFHSDPSYNRRAFNALWSCTTALTFGAQIIRLLLLAGLSLFASYCQDREYINTAGISVSSLILLTTSHLQTMSNQLQCALGARLLQVCREDQQMALALCNALSTITIVPGGSQVDTNRFKVLLRLIESDASIRSTLPIFFQHPPLLPRALSTLRNAYHFLDANLSLEYTLGTLHDTSDSSESNVMFKDDPIKFLDMFTDRGLTLWSQFIQEIRQLQCLYNEERICQLYASVEGDVANFCVLSILRPAIAVLNDLIESRTGNAPSCRVGLRGQLRVGLDVSRSSVDHALVLHDAVNRPVPGKTLVIFEEKIVNCMRGQYSRFLSETRDSQPVAVQLSELKKMLPQIRKYVFGLQTVYAMESDGLEHAAMIWDGLPGWTSGNLGQLNGVYGNPSGWMARYEHLCKVHVVRSAVRGQNECSPRMLLTFLGWLALKDEHIL